MNKKRHRTYTYRTRALLRELRTYEREGTHLYLGNRPSSAEDITRACMLAEDSGYMRDFVGDEADRITEIHFIRINKEPES